MNPTLWINPVNPGADQDCLLWNNDQNLLCYNCNSCRAGLLGNLRKEWRRANVILIVAVVVLIWVYLIACSAFKNAQTEELFRRYKQGWAWASLVSKHNPIFTSLVFVCLPFYILGWMNECVSVNSVSVVHIPLFFFLSRFCGWRQLTGSEILVNWVFKYWWE